MLAIALLLSGLHAAPSCDAPEIRQALVQEWSRMADNHPDSLGGSEVRVWNLRPDGKNGDCRADFLARRPGATLGGSIPFQIRGTGGGFRLVGRGAPEISLLQSDSARR